MVGPTNAIRGATNPSVHGSSGHTDFTIAKTAALNVGGNLGQALSTSDND